MHLPCVFTYASLRGFLCQPIFLIQTAPLQTRDSVHSGPAYVKRFHSTNDHRVQCFWLYDMIDTVFDT